MSFFKRIMASLKSESAANESGSWIGPRQITGEEFDAVVLKSKLPVVVDFWAEWCGACHLIEPAVMQLTTAFAGRAEVVKLNADDYPEIAKGCGVKGLPALLFFKDGQVVDYHVGNASYGALRKKLENVLAEVPTSA